MILLVGGDLIRWWLGLYTPQSNKVATKAKGKYGEILGKDTTNYCYGRVAKDEEWISLQYHYFYAYNDYRMTANGVNHHEGDWEAVIVFLKCKGPNPGTDYEIHGVACSQHENGKFRFRDEISWGADEAQQSLRPIIYVALGSHANYFVMGNLDTSLQFSGITRQIVTAIDGILDKFSGGNKSSGLPDEIAHGDLIKNDAEILFIDDNNTPGWVQYKGLWGKKTGHSNESGPHGPRWEKQIDKVSKKISLKERSRWLLHEAKDILLLEITQNEDNITSLRRKAIQSLIKESKQELLA